MKKLIILLVLLIVAVLLVLRFNQFMPSPTTEKTAIQPVDWQHVVVDKVEVYKSRRELKLLQQGQVIKTYKMRLGFEPVGHKTTEGDGKTPEGLYRLDWRNPNSQFYKSLHISYPNAQDQAQAKARGVSAGGDVMIHGSMKALGGAKGQPLYHYLPAKDWTWGCIAVSNEDMDELWNQIKNNTPIEIFP
ncbi:L,D-transpeptidase family protein [Acinetobacter populi]|uniref:L,D-transpeptidase catalytic domain protein n=1 Tax=Acinetobacter populi TaxID=1582270 RepID=A0A1Z9Z2S4_9GAMM|nr:L,D-transpeptidase family protein [Acinetobacter populi]OUY08746.1 L,D-transpeptidase catalytic domain protein [Acinetobacter populi]